MSRPGRSASCQPRVVVCTGMSTSSAAVRPIMSAPGPRSGSSGRCGRSGSSPKTTRQASTGSVPGIDPIPVALAAGHGNCWFCSLTVLSLMLPSRRSADVAELEIRSPTASVPRHARRWPLPHRAPVSVPVRQRRTPGYVRELVVCSSGPLGRRDRGIAFDPRVLLRADVAAEDDPGQLSHAAPGGRPVREGQVRALPGGLR